MKKSASNLDRATAENSQAHAWSGILKLLHESCGVDFSEYNVTSVSRRVAARMSLLRIQTLEEFYERLKAKPKERKLLFESILVPTTSFFREKPAFVALKRKVFPQLTNDRAYDDPVRIWIAGCSSGQEAYSIAIAFLEFREKSNRDFRFQMFATDTSWEAVRKARIGLYPKSITKSVSPDRLNRFFSYDRAFYQVHSDLRDQIIFARHTLGVDPPFGHMDLISCQNVLIYFRPELQKRVIRDFHFALRPNGFLLLGPAESISLPGLFETSAQSCKLFMKAEPS